MGINAQDVASTPLLDQIHSPADLRKLGDADLVRLAGELRTELVNTVSRTGGHLGSGLGVVELTIALHAVFDTPSDILIWDVGHQCYPHKILTGRRKAMANLRSKGGPSGFTCRAESSHDPFGAAHSSTSISAGLGFAAARHLAGDDRDVVCVIGDGAMSAGMAFEALNNAQAAGGRLFIIVNHNDMSISPAVGALSAHLRDLAAAPDDAGGLFGALGLPYRGVVDGHDLPELLAALRDVHDTASGPVVIHVKTRKGAGYAPAEASADRHHGVGAFDVDTGRPFATASKPSYTSVFADALIEAARLDERIVAITAGMASGTGLDKFAAAFPDRMFDVGIAEQHAVTFAAGLAAAGMRPFCAIYSTFLQRAYDQIVHDVAIQGLPVRFAIDRAGLVGADGATHAGSFDIGFLSALPGFTVMAASDGPDLQRMIATAARHDSGPVAFRYPRGDSTGALVDGPGVPLPIGTGRILADGSDVAILSLGTRLAECLKARDLLAARGISASIADARFAKPLDTGLVERLARSHDLLVTVEEGAVGGFGSAVLNAIANAGHADHGLRFRSLCLPDRFIGHGNVNEAYDEAGMSAEKITELCLAALDHSHRRAPLANANAAE